MGAVRFIRWCFKKFKEWIKYKFRSIIHWWKKSDNTERTMIPVSISIIVSLTLGAFSLAFLPSLTLFFLIILMISIFAPVVFWTSYFIFQKICGIWRMYCREQEAEEQEIIRRLKHGNN